MSWAKLKTWGLAIGGILLAVFYARTKKAEKKAADARAESARRNATAAEKRTEQLIKAQKAAGIAGVEGQEELDDAMGKIRRGGTRDHFESGS